MDKYYEAPSDEIFEEVKKEAIELWKIVDTDNDKYGYATSKINRIKDIGNVKDNTMYMVAMFDHINIQKLLNNLSDEAKKFVSERIN